MSLKQKRFKLLARLEKQNLDTVALRVRDLETRMYETLSQLQELHRLVESEKNFTSHNLLYSYTWREYLARAQEQERELLHVVDQLNRSIVWERKNLTQHFQKLKGFEISMDNVKKEHLQQEQKNEQKMLDECAQRKKEIDFKRT